MIFKKNIYPDFFRAYLDSFTSKTHNLETLRFVVFDTETTSLDIKTNAILSIGCIGITNFKIDVNDQLECYIQQEYKSNESIKIHGLLKKSKEHTIDENKALQLFLKYIQNAVLVAHHAAFDVKMINKLLIKNNLPKLKNKVIDTAVLYKKSKYVKDNLHYSLDDLCAKFNIQMHDRHTASGDAFLTALVFLKIAKKLKHKKGNLKLKHFTSWYF